MCQIIVLRNDNLGEKFYIDSIFSHKQVCIDITFSISSRTPEYENPVWVKSLQ